MSAFRVICPNGHLGFAPLRVESFKLGVAAGPDCIAADSGSDDVGPIPLGSDTSTSPLAWQTHDLEQMLLASRELGVPMIVGSSGDTGSNSRVDLFVRIIKELAERHRLKRFKVGYFYSELDREDLRRRMRGGEQVEGLDAR
ncbi:MAG: acyclic terpene utilization AtuA family protein, partial [Burkholderiales bacterium]